MELEGFEAIMSMHGLTFLSMTAGQNDPRLLNESVRLLFHSPMLRVTPAGATHALHYDSSNSILVQLRGVKRVTLVHESQLEDLNPYPRDHILFRRARMPGTPGGSLGWQGIPPVGKTVDLFPGDMIVFPSNTSHQTTAVEDTISVSIRYNWDLTSP